MARNSTADRVWKVYTAHRDMSLTTRRGFVPWFRDELRRDGVDVHLKTLYRWLGKGRVPEDRLDDVETTLKRCIGAASFKAGKIMRALKEAE